jgi:hypothetical protein
MSITTAQTGVDPGPLRGTEAVSPPLVSPAPGTNRPVPGTNGAPAKAKRRNLPINFPIQLKINMTPAMNNSLGRFCRRKKKKEAVFVRELLMDFFERHDPQYLQEIEGG